MLIPVYDSHGEMFEVRPALAKSLIINSGWFPNPPKAIEAEAAPVFGTPQAPSEDAPEHAHADS